MSTALEETRVVVQEAINVFNPQHDIEQVRAFKKTASEIGMARHQQQLALKSLIKDLTANIQITEKRIEKVTADDSSMQLINKLEKEKYNVSKVVSSSETEVAGLSSTLESLGGQLQGVRQQQQSLDKESVDQIDSTVVLMALYANITNLRWDYDEATAVKGFVANPAKNDVTPFNLNPAQSSEFYIANYLWDLIDG